MDIKQFKWEELFSKGPWEHKKIGDIAFNISSGGLSSKDSNSEGGNFPAIRLRNINKAKSPFIYECETRLEIRESTNKRVCCGDVMMVGSSSADTVGRTFVYLGKEECVADKNLWVIKHAQNPRYLLHALHSSNVRQQIHSLSQKKDIYWGIRKLSNADVQKLRIPLPPLEIQEQIANYLDDVLLRKIELSDSLEKMLEIRKKQYEFYKEQILTSEIDKWDR